MFFARIATDAGTIAKRHPNTVRSGPRVRSAAQRTPVVFACGAASRGGAKLDFDSGSQAGRD
jgi:hypothetical protein